MSNPINYSDFFNDDGAIDKLIKKLKDIEKIYGRLRQDVTDSFTEMGKSAKGFDSTTEAGRKEIERLEKEVAKLIKAQEALKKSEEEHSDAKKKATKLAKEEAKLLKTKNELLTEQSQANAKLKLEISELRKRQRENAKETLGLTNAYDRQSKRLRELRREYKGLAVAGMQNTKQAQALLKEVTKLDTELKEIDKSVGQTQRSVGNYKDQVKEALEETDVFGNVMGVAREQSGMLGEIIGKLNIVIQLLTKSFIKNTAETVENTVAQEANTTATKKASVVQRVLSKAVLFTGKSFKKLKMILVKSGIGLIIVALGSVVAFLMESSAGVEGLGRAMAGLGQAMKVLVGRIGFLGNAIVDQFQGMLASFRGFKHAIMFEFGEAKKAFAEAEEQNRQSSANWEKATNGIVKALKDAYNAGAEYYDLQKQIAKDSLNNEEKIAQLRAEAEINEEIEGDATRSFKERKRAILESMRLQKEASDLFLEQKQAELNAEKIKLEGFEKGTESYRVQNIAFVKKNIELIEAQAEADVKALTLRRTNNQLLQDELEKNLDIIIDGFDTQKTINEKIIDDEKRRFREREEMIARTMTLQKNALKDEVAEVQKTTDKVIDIRELIEMQDAKELADKIRTYELSEILEGRLLEIIKEARAQEQELNEQLLDLDEERINKKKEISEELKKLTIANIEDEKERALETIDNQERIDIEAIRKKQELYDWNEQEFADLQHQITEIQKKAQEDRDDAEIKAFEDQSKRKAKELERDALENGTKQKEIEIMLRDERIKVLEEEIEMRKELGEDSLDQELELAKLKAKKEKDVAKENLEFRQMIEQQAFDMFQDRINKEISLIEDKQIAQERQVDRQLELAKAGAQNTLAFEEAELARLEAEKRKLEEQAVRLEKVRALYNSYSSNLASGDNSGEALTKALRDFGIMQGIERAVMSIQEQGTGQGDMGDFLDASKNGSKNGNSVNNGVFRGVSHKHKSGGIPVLVERNEGIMNRWNMAKFGKENWSTLVRGIESGNIGKDFFNSQNGVVSMFGGIAMNTDPLRNDIQELKQEIKNKPVPNFNVESIRDSYVDLVKTVSTGNKKTVNRFRVNKKRI